LDNPDKDELDNPMDHPEEQAAATSDDTPRFGRLLVVLVLAVLLIGVLTLASEAYFSR
jgi:hypothetical protein